jgi:methylmalonyl-CoA/ethylmalonyl-CoA epimerase
MPAVRDFGLRSIGRWRRLQPMSNPSPALTQPVLGTRRVCQIAIVVRDIEKSARAYAEFFGLPVPPFITTDGSHGGHHVFRDRPTNARCLLAFFELENTTIELIQPLGGESSWQAVLDEKGEGVHHIAFQVKDSPGKTRALAAAGFPLLHQGGDPATGQFSYFDTRAKLGILIETLEGYK